MSTDLPRQMAPQLGSFHLSHPAGFCWPWFEQELPIDAAPGALLMLSCNLGDVCGSLAAFGVAIGQPFATGFGSGPGRRASMYVVSVLRPAEARLG